MAISVNSQFNAALVNDLEQFIAGFEQEAHALARQTVDGLDDALLTDLQQTPGRPKYPIEWTSERQRRAYFATNGFGAGIPYRRTGAYSAGWYVRYFVNGANLIIEIGNSSGYSQFVGGSLNQRSRREALVFQQQFHRNTGWKPAIDSVNPFLELVREQYIDRLKKRYDEFIQTSVRRRSKIT